MRYFMIINFMILFLSCNPEQFEITECEKGFLFENGKCIDVDECETKKDNCKSGYTCENIQGSFICNDINECNIKTDECSENAVCENNIGSYSCICKNGFSGNGKECNDIDECFENTDDCSNGYICQNTIGSFNCEDINECENQTATCEIYEVCINTNGSYACDINECLNETNNCNINAVCENIIDSFNCICKNGFEGNGIDCEDINECEEELDNCSENGICVNTTGDFYCECKNGFSGNGIICEDINECEDTSGLCENGYECQNIEGGYLCEDLNECLLNNHNCLNGYVCQNTLGSFNCNEFCGNDIITENEICDGIELNNETCNNFGYSAGNLICNTNCNGFKTNNCRITKQWGTINRDYPTSIIYDEDSNYYITGITEGSFENETNSGLGDIFLMKLNNLYEIIWIKQFGTTTYDGAVDIVIDNNNNILILGGTNGNFGENINQGGYSNTSDILLIKLDNNGNIIFSKQFGSNKNDYAFSMTIDSSNYIYIAGSTEGAFDGNTNQGYEDIFLTKFDNSGNKLWVKQWGTEYMERPSSILIDSNQNIFMTGYTHGNFDGNINMGSKDIFLTKLDNNGNKFWTKQWGTTSYEEGYALVVDSLGNIFVTGDTHGRLDGNVNSGNTDIFLTKLDNDGNKFWTKQWGGSGDELGISITSYNNNIVVVGYTGSNLDGNIINGSSDIFLTKFDNDGNKLWTKQSGSVDFEYPSAIKYYNGKLFISGHTYGSLDGNNNVNVDCIDSTDVVCMDIFLTIFEEE